MSFDVFLQRFVAGEAAGDGHGDAVQAVLERHRAQGSETGGYELQVGGRPLHFWAHASDCAFFLRGGVGGEVAALMFDLAVAGDMVVLPTMDPPTTILVRPEQAKELPARLAEPEALVHCASAGELLAILTRGRQGWMHYRDEVLGRRRE